VFEEKKMKAVIETGGFQYTVKEKEKIKIPKVDKKVGDKIKFSKILAIIDGKKSEFGKPYLKGCHVEGQVIAQERYPKVVSFKFKRRKDYKRTKGHRQHYTEVLVSKIAAKETAPKKKAAKKEEKPKKTTKKK
jgi:large subunit ribosomal protein L21